MKGVIIMTEKQMLTKIVELGIGGELTEDIVTKATENLSKRNRANEKLAEENEPLLEAVRVALGGEDYLTASETLEAIDLDLTVQKVSALIRMLVQSEEVETKPVKRVGKSPQNAYRLIE